MKYAIVSMASVLIGLTIWLLWDSRNAPPRPQAARLPEGKCPFYGVAAFPTQKLLLDSQGNQCALLTDITAPCSMELRGKEPDVRTCPLAHASKLAGPFAQFRRVSFRELE